MDILRPGACREYIEDGVVKPDIFSLYLGDEVQCYSHQQIMGWKILKKEELRIAILKFAL